MDVLLVSTNRCRDPLMVMPIGICCVAEATEQAGHRVRVLDLMFERAPSVALRETLQEYEPDVVGFSVRNVDNNDFCNPVRYSRDLDEMVQCVDELVECPTVIGGGAISVFPRQLLGLSGADFAVIGEGERAFPALLESFESGPSATQVPGAAWIDDDGFQLNPPSYDCPMPARLAPDYNRWIDLSTYIRKGAAVPLQTKRGCPHRCAYCPYPLLEGRRHRLADPAEAAQTVKRLSSRGVGQVTFVDNVFNDPPGHAEKICRALAQDTHEVCLSTMEINPANVSTGLLRNMEKAGFVGFGLTVESASQQVLEGLNKSFTVDDVQRAAEAVRKSELPCLWIYLLGGPGETKETVRKTLEFAKNKLRPGDAAVFFPGIRINPGTEIERRARAEGLLSDEVDLLEPTFYNSPELDPSWLVRTVQARVQKVPAFLSPSSGNSSFMVFARLAAEWLGGETPVWRHADKVGRLLSRFRFY